MDILKTSDAEKLVCPLMSNMITIDGVDETMEKLSTTNCICDKCMFWITTVNGKKEIDRVTEPYDMTPMDIGNWARRKIADGYVNIGREDGFRDKYVKYKETHEGYCQKTE